MTQFRYDAVDAEAKPITGEVDAASVAEAAAQLEAAGLTIRSISQVVEAVPSPVRAPPELVTAVNRLLDRGESAIAPIEAFARECSASKRRGLREVADTLKRGEPDGAIVAVCRGPAPWASLLAATTQSDPSLLTRLARPQAPAEVSGTRRWAHLAYPGLVLTVLMMVLWPIATLIVPIFDELYREFGLSLPAATELVLVLAAFLRDRGLIVIIALLIVVAVAYATWPRWGSVLGQGWLARIAAPSKLSVGTAAARSRVAADLLAARLPRGDALRLADLDAVSRPAIAKVATLDVSSPKLSALLVTLADCYEEQRPTGQAALFSTASGTAAIAVVGVLVGFTVIVLFLPLIGLVTNLS